MSVADRDTLPADHGTRYAVRFYSIRLAILGALILLAILVPALTVLFHRGGNALGALLVALVLLTLLAFRSSLRDRGALSPMADYDLATLRMSTAATTLPAAHRGGPRWLALLAMVPGARAVILAVSLLGRLLRRR